MTITGQIPRNTLLVGLIVVLLLAGGVAYIRIRQVMSLSLQLSMSSSVDSTAQLFYDTGNGFNEKDSVSSVVKRGTEFSELRFSLPSLPIYSLRFDPLERPGQFYIKNIAILNGLGQIIQQVNVGSIRPISQLERFVLQDHTFIGKTTPNANDPGIFLGIEYPLESFGHFASGALLRGIIALLLILCLVVLSRKRKRIRQTLRRLVPYIVALALILNLSSLEILIELKQAVLSVVGDLSQFQKNLQVPRAGEYTLPSEIQEALQLLRTHEIATYRISKAWQQDKSLALLIRESAWPRRLEPDTALYTLSLISELTNDSNCVEIQRLKEVALVTCR